VLKRLTPPKTENKKALVSIAHADDLLLFAGGTVSSLVQAGWEIAVIRVTDDRWDSYQLSERETIAHNKREFQRAMHEIGISKIYELGLATDLLGDHSEVKLRKEFISVIREFRPFLTITFDPDSFLYEDNEDHKLVGKAMAEANWASGFDKHPNSGRRQLAPHLPLTNWYFGRVVAKATHYFNISKEFERIVSAASNHKTMLINMARQLELKAQTDNLSLNITSEVEKYPNKFVGELMSRSRLNQIKGVKYAEIFRVIDNSQDIAKLRSN
jgi:LmbE family N-acetylglucosaminyl deacetylase